MFCECNNNRWHGFHTVLIDCYLGGIDFFFAAHMVSICVLHINSQQRKKEYIYHQYVCVVYNT